MKTSFKGPEQSPGYLLWKLSIDWQRRQKKALSEFGITHVQFVCLASLRWLNSQQGEATTQAKLAEFSGNDKMVVSEVCKQLITKKYLRREKSAHDKRAYTLKLTAAGIRLSAQTLPIVEAIDREFFCEKRQSFCKLNRLSQVLTPKD